jgi:hypothetical protein
VDILVEYQLNVMIEEKHPRVARRIGKKAPNPDNPKRGDLTTNIHNSQAPPIYRLSN